MLKLKKQIWGFRAVLVVQMCILCCLGWSSVQFTSSRVSWLSSPTEPCLFHQFANPVCIPALDVSTPALYRKEQSAGQQWLVEHVECLCGGLQRLHGHMSEWPEVFLIQSFGLQMLFKMIMKHITTPSFLSIQSDLIEVEINESLVYALWSSNGPLGEGSGQIGFGFTHQTSLQIFLCTACAWFTPLTFH